MAGNNSSTEAHFFEGVEKLLEIWFSPSDDEEADLRRVSRSVWEALLAKVKCEIISFSKNDNIDAYVLSESSMFVTKRRWLLKTCGTTRLLESLKPLLAIAAQHGFDEVEDVFYSRKNFARPELQVFPHRGFTDEVTILDAVFDNGRSYCLGSLNRDCWYLYTFSRNNKQAQQPSSEITATKNPEPDQTIEILMRDLDVNTMAIFSKEHTATAAEATIKAGIHHIIPEMYIDDFLFDPCGYSMNGITTNGQYMTIHITPEKEFSYVSFESNIAMANYASLISRVIRTFQPTKFDITIFANQTSEAYASLQDFECTEQLTKWSRTDMQYSHFPSYNLIFAQYQRD